MDADFPIGMIDEIEAFLQDEPTRRPGQDIYPGVFETNHMFPLQRKGEMAKMMQEAREVDPRVVMEIGTDKSGGLYHWIKCHLNVEKVIACEVRGTPYDSLFERAFPHIQFLWLPQSSYSPTTVEQVSQWLGQDRIDCLFIDGDKGAFLQDFELYAPFCKRGGKVFMHDIQDGGTNGPKESFINVSKRYMASRIIDTEDTRIALRREAQGIPIANAHEGWLRYWKGKSAGVGVVYL